jgi:hypothetical protein
MIGVAVSFKVTTFAKATADKQDIDNIDRKPRWKVDEV